MTPRDRSIAAALGRAAVYAVLAAAFDRPTPERLQSLGARAAAAAGAWDVPSGVRAALLDLARAAEATDAEALAAEHGVLLDGAVRCSPYEGAWGPQQLSGKAAQLADVAGFYAAFGLAPTTWNAELEDHVAAECEFSAALALKEAHALAGDEGEAAAVTRQAAATFLRDHLGRWGESFAEALGREARTRLYKEAAALLAGWLRAEASRLRVAPSRVTDLSPEDGAPFTCPMAPPAAED